MHSSRERTSRDDARARAMTVSDARVDGSSSSSATRSTNRSSASPTTTPMMTRSDPSREVRGTRARGVPRGTWRGACPPVASNGASASTSTEGGDGRRRDDEKDDDDLLERLKNIARETNARRLSVRWMDFVHSKGFKDIVSEVYESAASARERDGLLDVVELELAVSVLHERLNERAEGHLPRPKTDAKELMKEFDADKNGSLDLEEFHRFAMCYFSRLDWPLWRVFTRGAAIGLGTYVAHEIWINPLVQRAVKVILPRIIAKIRKNIQDQIGGTITNKWEWLRIKMKDGNVFVDNDDERRELQALEKRARRAKYIARAKAVGVAAVIGGSSAAAGFV